MHSKNKKIEMEIKISVARKVWIAKKISYKMDFSDHSYHSSES